MTTRLADGLVGRSKTNPAARDDRISLPGWCLILRVDPALGKGVLGYLPVVRLVSMTSDRPQLIVRAGKPYQVTQPERRAALEDLRDQLQAQDLAVELEIAEYVPGRMGGVASGEAVAIYVGGAASVALIGALVDDVYAAAKRWAKSRFEAKAADKPNPRSESFTIYGPDNEVLKTWKIDKDGEHEH